MDAIPGAVSRSDLLVPDARIAYEPNSDDVTDLVPDLAQEVYLKLVQHDGRILRSFRGTTEFSVMTFLSSVSWSVVQDHQRAVNSARRQQGQVVSIESVRPVEVSAAASHASPASDSSPFDRIVRLIDIERVIQDEPDRKNARRNALIFKLHFFDEFQASEIAQFPGFGLTRSGVETIIARFRKRFES